MNDLTRDDFLGGRVSVYQPAKGYRAGVDPVLLAAACPAKAGQEVLELGCGVGVASLCLAERTQAQVLGVERQGFYAGLARRNGLEVVDADLTDLPRDLRQRSFDHVIANPPYYERGTHKASADEGRAEALGEDTPQAAWIEAASRRLKPKGYLTLIQRADRLHHVLSACEGRLGSLQVLPLVPREGRDASLIVLRARKEGRAPFRLHAPVVMHEGAVHGADASDYTPELVNILQNGAALNFPH